MDNNIQGQLLQLDLPQDVAEGVYSNFAKISHSSSECALDFAAIVPGAPKASVRSRVLMAPEHVKRLLGALQENVIKYEQEFGIIRIPNQQPRTISPFGNTKGEA